MSLRPIARATLGVAAAATATCVLAAPALAYPPGTDPVLTTLAGGYTVGTAFPVTMSNVAPGCQVQFTVTRDGKAVGSYVATSGKAGTASATVPGQADAGAYTVTAHGVASTTNADCATGDVSTIVVVSGNGANSGNNGKSGTGTTTAATKDDSGIFGVLTGERARNLGLILLAVAAAFFFVVVWRRRHEDDQPPVEVPGGPQPPTT